MTSWADATPRTGAQLLADLQEGYRLWLEEQARPRMAPQYVVSPAEYEVLRRLRQDIVLWGPDVALERLAQRSPYDQPGAPIRADHVSLRGGQRLRMPRGGEVPVFTSGNRHERRRRAAEARHKR